MVENIGIQGRKPVALVFLLASVPLVLLGFGVFARAVAPTPGDVYAGIGSGLVAHYTAGGTFIENLDSTTGSSESTGMCFDAGGNLIATMFSANTVSKFSPTGALLAANFGTGYNQHPESCTVNAAGNVFIGQADGTEQIRKLDANGAFIQAFSPTVGPRGTDWIDLSADQCTMLYASEGPTIRRFNVCTGTQMTDFGSAPGGSQCFANRIRPNGEVLLACTTPNAVYRFGPAGNLAQTYTAFSPVPTGILFALNLDPDNATFWTADLFTRQIYRMNIVSGTEVSTFTAAGQSSLAGLSIAGEINVAIPTPTPTAPPGLPNTGRGAHSSSR